MSEKVKGKMLYTVKSHYISGHLQKVNEKRTSSILEEGDQEAKINVLKGLLSTLV